MKKKIIKLCAKDNVAIVISGLEKGTAVNLADGITIMALNDIPKSHKIAIANIQKGEMVYRYCEEIGYATQPITIGEWVHTHNLDSLDMMQASKKQEDIV